MKQIKLILVTIVITLYFVPARAQVARAAVAHSKTHTASPQLTEFLHLVAEANVSFIFPKGFKEIKAANDEDFSFDYAMEMPGKDFEIWLQVKSQKENWASYIRTQNSTTGRLANPDSLYTEIGAAQAISFTGDKQYFVRSIPPDVLAKYNADAGKSYLLTLLDLPETKHYKYALLISLQKNHTGTILAVCFTNEKGPEFYKNINKASQCLKFKP